MTRYEGTSSATKSGVSSTTDTGQPAISGVSNRNELGLPLGPGVHGSGHNAPGVYGDSTEYPGVHGHSVGSIGVRGTGGEIGGRFEGEANTGVWGESGRGVGGTFKAGGRGQIRLIPESTEFFDSENGPLPVLPGSSDPGELRAVVDDNGNCTLWLCITAASAGGTGVAATGDLFPTWAQVSVGTTVVGTAF